MADALSQEDDDNSCPICLDEFKSPKLLPCRHTFCSWCLEAYCSRSKQVSDTFSCPFCRNQCQLPKGGVHGLLSNYFVYDKCSKTTSDLCENCSEPLTSDICTSCQDSVDLRNEDTTEDDNISEASDDLAFIIPVSLSCVQRSSKQTNCKMAIDSTISLSTSSESEDSSPTETEISHSMVSALCPTPYNECLVVVNCHGDIFKIKENGEKTDTLHIGRFELRDIALRSDGKILLLTKYNVYTLHDLLVYNFVNFEPYIGLSIAAFRDNRVVITCYEKAGKASEETEDRDLPETGVMLILSDVGEIMYKVKPGEGFPAFRPFDVAINPISDLIYTSDPIHGIVYIFLECGTFVDKVDAGFLYRWLRLDSFVFIPCGISCDSKGNVVVCDRGTGNLVHLSPDGNLKGVFILESPTEEREIPWLVKLGDNGTIWVGYKPSCTVRTFSVKQFINRLD